MFDEHSLSWQLVSRWPVLAGGPAALLLQVAHPSVAAGVSQHSAYAADPFGRLERTLKAMLSIAFGSPGHRDAMLAELGAIHRRVTGVRDDGAPYRALDPSLQCWVWATLVHVSIEIERRYAHELSVGERRRYYLESTEIARAFRIPQALIPADLDAFDAYVAATVSELVVIDVARDIARSVLHPEVWWMPRPLIVPLEWVTVDLLDERLVRDYGLPRLTTSQRRAVRGAKRLGRAVIPHLPDVVLTNPLNRRAIA
jgi:uncharacterized protein (DUF2236 family)